MINLVLPVGTMHGWGICGINLSKALAAKTEIRLITQRFSVEQIGSPINFAFLKPFVIPFDAVARLQSSSSISNFPVIQAISDHQFNPWGPDIQSKIRVGYCFFEENRLAAHAVEAAKRKFDIIATGSSWCAETLRRHGIDDVANVIQGIDPQLFNGSNAAKSVFQDRFVIFSGGKFEFRKAQDIAIRAVQVLQQRHADVWLINAWFNPWTESMRTMAASKYIRFGICSADYTTAMNAILAKNGIDLHRVMTLPPLPNALMPQIYKNTDIGLFPNRCEGGTNLVLMEYMACGKPVIASGFSGHRDIISAKNALEIKTRREITLRRHGEVVAVWEEPDLDETVELLEYAYQNQHRLQAIGAVAARDLAKYTWSHMADAFLALLGETAVHRAPDNELEGCNAHAEIPASAMMCEPSGPCLQSAG